MGRTPEFELYADAAKAIEYGLGDVANKLFLIIEAKLWEGFEIPLGRTVSFGSFEEFVTTARDAWGLGTDMETIARLMSGNPRNQDALDRVCQHKPGAGKNQHTECLDNNVQEAPKGNSRSRALRRLRKDRPDLHDLVLAEEVSAHAAMVEAGFRPPTCTVRLDDPERIASTLKRRLSPDVLRCVVELLAP